MVSTVHGGVAAQSEAEEAERRSPAGGSGASRVPLGGNLGPEGTGDRAGETSHHAEEPLPTLSQRYCGVCNLYPSPSAIRQAASSSVALQVKMPGDRAQ